MSYHNLQLQGSARDRRKYFINCQRCSYTQFKLRLTFTHISSSLAQRGQRNRSSSVHNIYLFSLRVASSILSLSFCFCACFTTFLHWFSFTLACLVIIARFVVLFSFLGLLFSLELILIVNWSLSWSSLSSSSQRHTTKQTDTIFPRLSSSLTFNVLISSPCWQLNHIFMKFNWHCATSGSSLSVSILTFFLCSLKVNKRC